MRLISTYIALVLSAACVVLFQNCSGSFRANERAPSSVLSSFDISKSNFSVQSIDAMTDNDPIDLAPFFSSAKIPQDQSRFSLFQEVGKSDNNVIVAQSKFNQFNNFEIFVVTPSAILMRYEVSPEIYGGDKNALRRFRDVPVRSEDIRGATALPVNGDNGAMWIKRMVTKTEAGKVFVAAQAIDHVVYTNPKNLGTLSVPYFVIYNWFEFTQNTVSMPFVNSGETILRIYSQWHPCVTEVYEYAQGVGLTAWRALDSSSAACNLNLDKSKPSVMLRNHFTGADERFYIVAGDLYDGVFSQTVYSNRVVQNYSPGGIFMDDHLYNYTTPKPQLLSFLKPAPVLTPPVVEQPFVVVTPPLIQEVPVVIPPPVIPPQGGGVLLPDYSKEVASYYQTYLGRTPASSEISYWVSLLDSKTVSLSQVQQQIQNSQEAIIRGFYLTYLQREPDYPGLTYWRQQNSAGVSFELIRQYIRKDANCVSQCL